MGWEGHHYSRAILGEELTVRALVHTSAWSMPEVLGPAVVTFGDPGLTSHVVPLMLSGAELWCQGFSEPEAGSDLGSLKTAARKDGEGWSNFWTEALDELGPSLGPLCRAGTNWRTQ